MSYTLFYKIKDEFVNDCFDVPRVGYLDLRQFNHYSCDGYLNLHNASMCIAMKNAPKFEEVDTFYTEEEYNTLCAKGEWYGDATAIDKIYEKYFGGSDNTEHEAYVAFAKMIEAQERELIMEECDCDLNTAIDIQWCMPYGYIDVDTIGYIYDNAEEVAINLVNDCYDLPDSIMNYIDFKKMGDDMVNSDIEYYEMEDGRVVWFYAQEGI